MISPISGSTSNFETSRIRDTKRSQVIAQPQSIGNQRLAVPPVNRVIRRNDTVEISARGREAQQQKAAAKAQEAQANQQQISQVPLTPQEQEAASPDLQAALAALTQQVAPGAVDQNPNAGAANTSERTDISASSGRTAMSASAQRQSSRSGFNQVSVNQANDPQASASKPSVSKQETTVTKQNSAIFQRAVASYSQYSQQPTTPAQTQIAALNLIA